MAPHVSPRDHSGPREKAKAKLVHQALYRARQCSDRHLKSVCTSEASVTLPRIGDPKHDARKVHKLQWRHYLLPAFTHSREGQPWFLCMRDLWKHFLVTVGQCLWTKCFPRSWLLKTELSYLKDGTDVSAALRGTHTADLLSEHLRDQPQVTDFELVPWQTLSCFSDGSVPTGQRSLLWMGVPFGWECHVCSC